MITICRPRGICATCYEKVAAAAGDAETGEFAGYCLHRRTGGIYQPSLNRWILFEPISHEDFLRKLSSVERIARPLSQRGIRV
jgi:hypothetical protein